MKRCFELINEDHQKFWTVEVVECYYLATYGKIGTKGQTQVKKLPTPAQAEGFAQKMMNEKTGKGYQYSAVLNHPGAPEDMLKALGIYHDESKLVSHLMHRAFDGIAGKDGK